MLSRLWGVLIIFCPLFAVAESVGQPLDVFLKANFSQQLPQTQTFWLKPELKKRIEQVLNHPYQGLRVRYWQSGQRTAWVLDEVGKEQPITTGIVVENGRIVDLDVLAYRESRGGEVQQSFFTKQFHQLALTSDDKLSKKIDGITGATLSVWALQKMARVALILDAEKPAVVNP